MALKSGKERWDGRLVEGDMEFMSDTGLWVPVSGTKATGKVPTIQSDGTVGWETPAGGGGTPAVVRLDGATLGSAAATISITIPSGYRDVLIVIDGRGTTSGNDYCRPRVRLNSDSTSNHYDWSRGNFSDAGFTMEGDASGGAAITTAFDIGHLPSSISPASYRGRCQILVSDYLNSSAYKAVLTESSSYAAAIYFRTSGGGNWKNTAAVTSATLLLDAGNYDTGTVWTLYGIL